MMQQNRKIKYLNLLHIASVSLIAVLVCWPIFMALTTFDGTTQQQLLLISDNLILYVINFVVASFISPLFTFVLVVFVLILISEKILNKTILIVAICLLLVYVVLSSISYLSQVFVFSSLVSQQEFTHAPFYYFNNHLSVVFIINQLGYVFFASGVIVVGYKLLFQKGILKSIAIIMFLSAILSILAFIGLLINQPFLQMFSVVSGLFALGLAITILLYSTQQKSLIKKRVRTQS